MEVDENYDSASKSCYGDDYIVSGCAKYGFKYNNGYFKNYNIIGRGFNGYIPGKSSILCCKLEFQAFGALNGVKIFVVIHQTARILLGKKETIAT